MLKRSLPFWILVACAAPMNATEEAESGPRAERVVVTRTDGTRTEVAPPAPVPVKIRARPSAQEIARAAAAAQPPKAKPLVTVTPRLANPLPRVLAAPVPPRPPVAAPAAPTVLTAKDHESLRWLTRLRAKYPERYTQELVNNARARELIFAASKLSDAEQEQIFRPAIEEDDDEDHGGAAPAQAVPPDDEEEAEY